MYRPELGVPRPAVQRPEKNPDRIEDFFCPLCGMERFQQPSVVGTHQSSKKCRTFTRAHLLSHGFRVEDEGFVPASEDEMLRLDPRPTTSGSKRQHFFDGRRDGDSGPSKKERHGDDRRGPPGGGAHLRGLIDFIYLYFVPVYLYFVFDNACYHFVLLLCCDKIYLFLQTLGLG